MEHIHAENAPLQAYLFQDWRKVKMEATQEKKKIKWALCRSINY